MKKILWNVLIASLAALTGAAITAAAINSYHVRQQEKDEVVQVMPSQNTDMDGFYGPAQ